MGMTHNAMPVDTFTPLINLDSLSQRQDGLNLPVNQAVFEPSTVLIVSSPSDDAVREELIKQPVFVVNELPSNATNCTYIQVPTNIIQMPSIAPNVVNLIQVPTINVQVPSTFLVANNNLILCVPPEGITLQMQTDSSGNELLQLEEDALDVQSKTIKAKLWHADSDLVNRALTALNNDGTLLNGENTDENIV